MNYLHSALFFIVLLLFPNIFVNGIVLTSAMALSKPQICDSCKNLMESQFKPPPLYQFKLGITASKVTCRVGFDLVIKRSDNSPACVKPQTAQKLVERGWGNIPSQVQATDTSVSLSVNVNRMASLDPSLLSKTWSLDITTISQYPVLLDAMKVADERYQEWVNNCYPHGCPYYSVMPWDMSTTYHISSQLANAMINDQNLHLHHHSTSDLAEWVTEFRVGNAVYDIQLCTTYRC